MTVILSFRTVQHGVYRDQPDTSLQIISVVPGCPRLDIVSLAPMKMFSRLVDPDQFPIVAVVFDEGGDVFSGQGTGVVVVGFQGAHQLLWR